MSAVLSARPRVAAALPWVSTAVRLALGGILLTAGGLKVIDPASSVQAVRAYELVPAPLDTLIGWALPFVEIVLGLLLVVGAFTRTVAVLSGGLLLVFVAAVFSAAVRGLSIDCGCFGGGGPVAPGQTGYTGEILRDLGFVALAAWLVARPESRLALDHGSTEDDE